MPLDLFSKDLVCIEISGSDHTPKFEHGDIISGPKTTASFDNLVGTDCILCLESGEKFLGSLTRGRKHNVYDVHFFDRRKDDLRDVRVTWAAPIRMILRGGA